MFHEGTFREALFPVDPPELWHRFEFVAGITILAVAIRCGINRRGRTEKTLKEGEERFRSLADATFEGVAISENGRVLQTKGLRRDVRL